MFFYNDLNIFFNDFAINCTINKNNNIIKILFDDNYINYTNASLNFDGTKVSIQILNNDITNNLLKFNDELTINNTVYIIKNIQKNSSGISQIILIEKD